MFPDFNFAKVALFITVSDEITRASKQFMGFNAPYFRNTSTETLPPPLFFYFCHFLAEVDRFLTTWHILNQNCS